MSAGRPEAYIYHNPDNPDANLASFEVVTALTNPDEIPTIAKIYQLIMNEAWSEQFPDALKSSEIAKTVDPNNPQFVAQATKNILATDQFGVPSYRHARIKNPFSEFCDLPYHIVSFGKAKYARSSAGRKLADLSDIYTRPFIAGEGTTAIQNNGYASAVIHASLDVYDDGLGTVFSEYEFNQRAWATLPRYRFKPVKAWPVDQFGKNVWQLYYSGQTVGELRQLMESKRPWLAERQPLLQAA